MAGAHDIIQANCFQHLWNVYPQTRRCMWHTPNELRPFKGESNQSHLVRIMQMKAVGVLKGVVDLTFYWRGCLYMFDIKIGTDRLSKDQQLFIDAIEAQGGKFYEINSLEQFVEVLLTLQLK